MDRTRKFWSVFVLLIVVPFCAIVVSYVGAFYVTNTNLVSQVDSSTINGVLTAIAIVFSFVSFEARGIKSSAIKFLFIGIMMIFLLITVTSYFLVVMASGGPNKVVLLVAMSNLVFNILTSVVVVWTKDVYDEEEEQVPKDRNLESAE